MLELADEARAIAPWLGPEDEHALRLWAMAVARLELASAVLLQPMSDDAAAVDEWAKKVEARPTLSRDARGWFASAARLANELGLTPSGRAAIALANQTTIALAEVTEMFTALYQTAGRFIDPGQRAAFMAAMAAVEAGLLGGELPALEEGDVVDGQAVEVRGNPSRES